MKETQHTSREEGDMELLIRGRRILLPNPKVWHFRLRGPHTAVVGEGEQGRVVERCKRGGVEGQHRLVLFGRGADAYVVDGGHGKTQLMML